MAKKTSKKRRLVDGTAIGLGRGERLQKARLSRAFRAIVAVPSWRISTAAAYREARPDPLADAATGILDHMNRDHADALIAYARHFAGEAADEATMTAVDRLGFRLRIRSGERLHGVRIAFPREVTTAAESRSVLIEMLAQVRAAT